MSTTPIKQTDTTGRQAVCAALQEAGVSDAQIALALETSGALLEQLAAYPLDDTHNRTVRDIFERLARSGSER